jgi:hypothetical protein
VNRCCYSSLIDVYEYHLSLFERGPKEWSWMVGSVPLERGSLHAIVAATSLTVSRRHGKVISCIVIVKDDGEVYESVSGLSC